MLRVMTFPVDLPALAELEQFLTDRYRDLVADAIAASRYDVVITVEASDTVRADARSGVADRFLAFMGKVPPPVIVSLAQGAGAGVAPRFQELRRHIVDEHWGVAWERWTGACRESCVFEDHTDWKPLWGEVADDAAEVDLAEEAAMYDGLFGSDSL